MRGETRASPPASLSPFVHSGRAADRGSGACIWAEGSAGITTPSPRGFRWMPAGPVSRVWRTEGLRLRRRRLAARWSGASASGGMGERVSRDPATSESHGRRRVIGARGGAATGRYRSSSRATVADVRRRRARSRVAPSWSCSMNPRTTSVPRRDAGDGGFVRIAGGDHASPGPDSSIGAIESGVGVATPARR
jgi:hypothetical protein